ncbi:MAG: hypothetical protein V5A76_04165, partial [Candidatus Thermoplasmatota archaeon]
IYPLTHDGLYMERTFMYSLIPASILAIPFLKHFSPDNFDLKNFSQVSIIVIIAALLLTVPITKNSIDTIETPSRSSYRAGRFAEEKFDKRVYITDTHQGMFKYIESMTSNDSSTTNQFRARKKFPQNQPYGYPLPRTDRTDLYPFLFTDYFNNYIEIRYGNTTAVREIQSHENTISNRSNRIYDSGGSRLYIDT